MNYFDRTGNPISREEMAQAFEGSAATRTLARDHIAPNITVSTVWLGIDHSFGEGPPLIFETMIFNGPLDQTQQRYSTEEQALAGHADLLQQAQLAHLPTNDVWDTGDWATLFGDGGYVDPTAYEIITQTDRGPVTTDRIVRVGEISVDRSEGWASVNIVLLAEARDGWLTCTAWCDTTGWDCQSGGRWHWAPTRDEAIRNGLDDAGREALRLTLPGEDTDRG